MSGSEKGKRFERAEVIARAVPVFNEWANTALNSLVCASCMWLLRHPAMDAQDGWTPAAAPSQPLHQGRLIPKAVSICSVCFCICSCICWKNCCDWAW